MLPKLFVFAHFEEAQPFLNTFPSKLHFQLKTIQCYHSEENNVYILITGSGFFNISVALSVFFERYAYLKKDILTFNIGIAGSFNKDLYQVFYISKITNYHTLHSFYPDVFIPFPIAELVSIEFPANKKIMAAYPDALFDMEGYAFATASKFFLKNHQIHCIKFVSDNDGCIQDMDELLNRYELSANSMLSMVQQIEKEVQAYFKEEENFDEEVQNIVSKWSEKLHLTHSQKIQLHKALMYCKQHNKNIDFIHSLNFGDTKKISKHKRNKYFQNILKQLYYV